MKSRAHEPREASRLCIAVIFAGALASTGYHARAQGPASREVVIAGVASNASSVTLNPSSVSSSSVEVAAELPDSPQPSPELTNEADAPANAGPVDSIVHEDHGAREFFLGSKEGPVERTIVAPTYHRYILPNQIAPNLTPRQRIIFGFHQPLSPFFLLTIAAASGYEQAVNGSPNYGSNFTAYGQRLGAAAIRNAAQSIFSDSLMAPMLHEDPRYYIMGDRHNAVMRGAYAITRVLVTRKDDGGATPNYALLSGYLEAAALNNAFYPAVNVGFRQTGRSFEGSLIGVGLGNIVREFLPDILQAAHATRFE